MVARAACKSNSGYDDASRLTSISRQIGSSDTATEVNTAISYDDDNRVVTMTDT